MQLEEDMGIDAANEISDGLQKYMVENGTLPATYGNIKKILIWIGTQRKKYAKQAKTMEKKMFSVKSDKAQEDALKRFLKANAAYDMLGAAWYDTLQGAEKLGFLDKLSKDDRLINLIKPEKEDKQRETQEIIDNLMRHAHLVTEVSGRDKPDSTDVGQVPQDGISEVLGVT